MCYTCVQYMFIFPFLPLALALRNLGDRMHMPARMGAFLEDAIQYLLILTLAIVHGGFEHVLELA